MKALTKTERVALLTELDEFNTRLAAKRREIDDMVSQKTEIARDVVLGKAGAKAQHLKLNDSIREAESEIEALLVAVQQSQQRWDDDAPARSAEANAARKAEAGAAALKVLEAAQRADTALREFVGAIGDRAKAAGALTQFIDLTDQRTVQQVGMILDRALAGAGIREFDPRFQMQPGAPESFAEDDAQALGAVLPADHPAVVANRRRQDARNAEHLQRTAAPPLEGAIVARRG